MKLHTLDIAIIVVYFVAVILIGLFIMIIGLNEGGIVVNGPTPLTLGNLTTPAILMFVIGLAIGFGSALAGTVDASAIGMPPSHTNIKVSASISNVR